MPDLQLMKLGAVLARLRAATGLPQAQLARNAGVAAPYLSQIETSRRIPSTKLIARIAGALETDWRPLARLALLEADPMAAELFSSQPIACAQCTVYRVLLDEIHRLAGPPHA